MAAALIYNAHDRAMQINNIDIGSSFFNLQPQVSNSAALSYLFGDQLSWF
jgi:hypothetical protein